MIGNWKMNQTLKDVEEFFNEMKRADLPQGNFWIAPQFIHLASSMCHCDGTQFKIGAQNCSEHDFGAFTGEVSATSLKDLSTHFVLLGHSERRSLYAEKDEVINEKVKKAMAAKLIPVLCIGETLEQREANKTVEVVLSQLEQGLNNVSLTNEKDIIIAYEPVWAIGTGKTATPKQAEEVHAQIRACLKKLFGDLGDRLSILYGGSVKPDNVAELLSMPNIDGGLVGGASLKASDFKQLCKATL